MASEVLQPSIEVFNYTGERRVISLDKMKTVQQLRERVVEEFPKIQGRKADVRMRLEDTALDNGAKLLSDFRVEHNSVIHLTLKVHGG